MSRENVEIVRRLYEAVARRDAEAVLSLYDPEVEWDMSRGAFGELEEESIQHGHEGLRSWFRTQYEAWEKWEDNPDELIDAGEHVVSVVTSRSRGRASGVDVESHHAAVWTVRQGKVIRVTWFPTREAALEAAGVSE
ncbi:MAG: nuclear transport factor 2 family protein [Thermoleophilaceae bacterium]